MTEPADVVLAYWRDHRDQLRQSENQRAVLTNYVLIIVAALSGFIVQQQLRPVTLPLSVLIVIIGLFGAVTVAKYHERAVYHLSQARALTRALVEAGQLLDNEAQLDVVRTAHYRNYPRLHRLHLHRLWTGLHIGIALYGTALSIVAALR
jgi:hypothetical protein